MAVKSDLELTKQALALGWITMSQLKVCLDFQRQTTGQAKSLLQLLLEQKYLTPAQLISLQGEDAAVQPAIGLKLGSTFEGYQIVAKLGAGGMGIVYKAVDTKIQRTVALKLLSSLSVTDQESRRFLQEAAVMAKLDHPNIVKVFQAQDTPRHYLTMEYVEGNTLGDCIKERTIVPLMAVQTIEKISEALAEVHQLGIIHRDIKPSNIMIAKGGIPKLMDFGLAKLSNIESSLSQSGNILGTPAYMSPEQANGKTVDKRTDIYSLGATFYECLTGRAPFQGQSYAQLVHQIVFEEPVAPRLLNPDVPSELEAIALKCLEKDWRQRYATAHELAKDLARYLDGKPVRAKPVTPFVRASKWIGRHRLATGTILAIMLAIAATIVFSLYQAAQATQAKNMAMLDKEQALQAKDAALSLKQQADEKCLWAVSEKAAADLKQTDARLNQAMAELLLAKLAIDGDAYFSAWQAHDDCIKSLQSINLPAMVPELADKYRWLKNSADNMAEYSLATYLQHQELDLSKVLPDNYRAVKQSQPSWKFLVIGQESHADPLNPKTDKVALWDWQTQRIVQEFDTRNSPSLTIAAFSQDDRWVAWGDLQQNITVVEIGSDKLLRTELVNREKDHWPNPNFFHQINWLRFSPDGRWLFAATKQNWVLLTLPGLTIVRLSPTKPITNPVGAFSSDSKQLAVVGLRTIVSLYDLTKITDAAPPTTFNVGFSTGCCFGLSDEFLLSGLMRDLLITPLKKESWNERVTLLGAYSGCLESIALSPDGQFFAYAAQDSQLRVWSSLNYRQVFHMPFAGKVNTATIAFHPGEKRVGVWTEQQITTYRYEPNLVSRLDLSHRKEMSQSQRASMKMTNKLVFFRNFGSDSVLTGSSSPDGKYLAFSSPLGLHLWDIQKDALHQLAGLNLYDPCRYLSFDMTGEWLMLRHENYVWIWHAASQKKIVDLKKQSKSTENMAFHPWQPLAVSHADAEGNREPSVIKFWRIENQSLVIVKELSSLIQDVTTIAFDRRNKYMAFANSRLVEIGTVEGWEAGRWRINPDLQSQISALCFSDGADLAIGDGYGTVVFYDVANRCIKHRIKLDGLVQRLWYDPSRKLYWLLTANGLFIYDSDQGEQLQQIYPLPMYKGYPILFASVTPDFKQLTLLFQAGEIWLVDLQRKE